MYTECLNCPKLGISCDGPNFVAMSAPELIEWCKKRKNTLGMSNQKLAELTGIPLGTINRLFAGANMDFKHETIRPMMQVLVGSDWMGNPCPNPDEHLEEAEHEKEENAKLRAQIEKLENAHAKELESIKSDDREKINYLKERVEYLKGTIKAKNIVITILASLLGVSVMLILGFLIIDFVNPDWGVFWRNL